jgi:hypothetical protein
MTNGGFARALKTLLASFAKREHVVLTRLEAPKGW